MLLNVNAPSAPEEVRKFNIRMGLALLVMALLVGCLTFSCENSLQPGMGMEPPCSLYRDFNVKPSRTIMELTGATVAPCWVQAIRNDGTVDLQCFPGDGFCPRVCRDDIPF